MQYFKQKSGFTIIELLVSMSVIAIITGIFLVNYTGSVKSNHLIQATNDLASTYRIALNNGLGLVKYNGSVPAGGWGVSVNLANESSFILFADVNNNQQYDLGEADIESGGRIVYLPEDMIIDRININDSASSTSRADVVFTAPYPTINLTVFPSLVGVHDIDIILQDSKRGNEKDVKINFLGLVDMLD